jgi:hypothetical protein
LSAQAADSLSRFLSHAIDQAIELQSMRLLRLGGTVKRTAILMFCSLVLFGCASRPAVIGTDANYVIEVTNPMPHSMNVSLDMGAGQMAALGEVAAGQTKQFQVRNPSSNDVIIKAVDQSQSHTVEKHVELERGTVSKVSLKD